MKKIYFSVTLLIFFSCDRTDCNALVDSYRKGSCKIVVKKMPTPRSVYNFHVIGKSITTNKDTIYNEENRWFCQLYKYISNGDTIIKHNGTTTFNIHKANKVLSFQYECNGKSYR